MVQPKSQKAGIPNTGEAPVVSVRIADHPSNLDPTAELVSGSREALSIFRVRGGFLVCQDGFALVALFASQDAARSALNSVREPS